MSDTKTRDERLAELDAQRREIIDEDGAEVSAPASGDGPGTAPARAEDVWPHETIDMFGETWEVRAPAQQALTAVTLSSGKYVPQNVQNDIVSMFLHRHMSAKSFARLFERLSEPDDDEFGPGSLGEIMSALAQLAMQRIRDAQD